MKRAIVTAGLAIFIPLCTFFLCLLNSSSSKAEGDCHGQLSPHMKCAKSLLTFEGGTLKDLASAMNAFGTEPFADMADLRTAIGLFLVTRTSQKDVDLTLSSEQRTRHLTSLVGLFSAQDRRLTAGAGQESSRSTRITSVVIAYCFSIANAIDVKNDYVSYSETWNIEKIARLYGVDAEFCDSVTGFLRADALVPVTILVPARGFYNSSESMRATVVISYIDDSKNIVAIGDSISKYEIKLTHSHPKHDWELDHTNR